MIKTLIASATLCAAALLAQPADASSITFTFAGGGVDGTITLVYGAATDAKYADAFEVTGISGTFSDSNNGLNIVDAPILGLVPITHDTPEATNLLAPDDFSRFAVASGLGPLNNGFLSFDNLYYPGGSPQTASDYPFHGGILDIYGLMFDIGNGRVVNFWSNGDFGGGPVYGAAVATHDEALDYADGVSVTVPEPALLGLLGSGILGLMARRRSARGR